jgi:hypothetical protein
LIIETHNTFAATDRQPLSVVNDSFNAEKDVLGMLLAMW